MKVFTASGWTNRTYMTVVIAAPDEAAATDIANDHAIRIHDHDWMDKIFWRIREIETVESVATSPCVEFSTSCDI